MIRTDSRADAARAAKEIAELGRSQIRDARLRQVIGEIQDWATRTWSFEDAPNLVVYSLRELAYSYPKRANDLIQSMRTLMSLDRLVPSVILARALIETVAMGRYFIEKMELHLNDGDYQKLEGEFLKFYTGSRLGDTKIKSVHVNDALRDLEERDLEYLAYLIDKHPKLWRLAGSDPLKAFKDNASLLKTYDRLSEISHPNGLGTQYLYPADDAPSNTKVVDHYRQMTGAAVWQAHHLVTALKRLDSLLERFVQIFPNQTHFSDGIFEEK